MAEKNMKIVKIERCPNPRNECDSTEAVSSGQLMYCRKCFWHFKIITQEGDKKREDQRKWKEKKLRTSAVTVECKAKGSNEYCKGSFTDIPNTNRQFCCPECKRAYYSTHGYNKNKTNNTEKEIANV